MQRRDCPGVRYEGPQLWPGEEVGSAQIWYSCTGLLQMPAMWRWLVRWRMEQSDCTKNLQAGKTELGAIESRHQCGWQGAGGLGFW